MPTIDFSRLPEVMNMAYYKYLTDYRYYQVFKGGGSAGKSVFIAQKIVYNMVNKKGYNGLCVRKVGADNHISTFQELVKCIDAWGLTPEFIINRSKGAEEITFKGNGNKVIFKGLDDVRKLKSITFKTGPLIFIWLEEADEDEEDDLNELMIRLRGSSDIPKHFIISFNPVDGDSWLKSRFFDRPIDPVDGFVLETTYHDNRFLTDQDRKMLESIKDIDYQRYRVYVLNEWGDWKGLKVFGNLKIHEFDPHEGHFTNVRHGMDFGFVHANTLMGTGYRENELYIFREHYIKGMENPAWIDMIQQSDFEPDYRITADSASPGYISAFHQAGFNISGATKGPGSLKNGINYLKSLSAIHIHSTRCPNAVREFQRFSRRQLKNGLITDEYVELDDDTIAGVRYGNEEFFISGVRKKPRNPFTRGAF